MKIENGEYKVTINASEDVNLFDTEREVVTNTEILYKDEPINVIKMDCWVACLGDDARSQNSREFLRACQECNGINVELVERYD